MLPRWKTPISLYMSPLRKAAAALLVTLLLLVLGITSEATAQATQRPPVKIDSPQPGEALQGVVQVNGTSEMEGFRSAEVAFAYQSDTTGTWFLIQQSSTAVKEGLLASWDTSTITDGVYRLRIQVFLEGGGVQESLVEGLRVRNYTPIETVTPAPATLPTGQAEPVSTATQRLDFQVSPHSVTALPTNPAQLTPRNLQSSALRGMLVVFGAFIVALAYMGLRAITRR
jgi:hypothetical protein